MKEHPKPSVAVDVIIEKDESVLFVKRKKEPFKGSLTIPGGFVNVGERVEDAAVREALKETSLNIEPIDILGVYSDPQRDPIGHTIGITFIGKIISGEAKAGDDAGSFEWVSINDKINLAFDHDRIIQDYRGWKKSKGTYWSSK